jgi:hypothetical protein
LLLVVKESLRWWHISFYFFPVAFALVFAAQNKLPEFLEQLVIHAEVALDLFLAINSILFGSDGSCLLPLLLGEHGGYSVCTR